MPTSDRTLEIDDFSTSTGLLKEPVVLYIEHLPLEMRSQSYH
ncbi:MAG: hypothetical protein V7K18_07505 [Nostoc sp.]